MTVYIEYAFLQNFFLDGVLLWLSYKGTKTPIRWRRLLFSSLFGGVFAVLYPLLKIPLFLGGWLKIFAGALLCLLAYGKVKRKKEWKRVALFTLLFFSLSFLFGGAIGAIVQGDQAYVKTLVTPLSFLGLSFLCIYLFRKVYRRVKILKSVYACVAINGNKSVALRGFFDNGNQATKGGVPVCFVSPEIVYELWGEECLLSEKERRHVCDEICITTVTGKKNTPIYRGRLQIKDGEKMREIKEVYFAPGVNMISREYEIILHSRIFDEGEEV